MPATTIVGAAHAPVIEVLRAEQRHLPHDVGLRNASSEENPNHHAWLSPYGNSIVGKILVTRPGHFVGRRQIAPELEAVNGDAFGGDFIVD